MKTQTKIYLSVVVAIGIIGALIYSKKKAPTSNIMGNYGDPIIMAAIKAGTIPPPPINGAGQIMTDYGWNGNGWYPYAQPQELRIK